MTATLAALPSLRRARRLGAIDVGTNSVRLAIALVGPDGALAPVREDRESVRPGEGVFTDGMISPAACARLIEVLHRFRSLGQQHRARLRAVATSAFRHARNADDVARRVRWEVGLDLEIISGREEARLMCLGALHDRSTSTRSLVIDVGGGSTEVVLAQGHAAVALWSLPLGCVRLTELAARAQCRLDPDALYFMRRLTLDALDEAELCHVPTNMRMALGASGTVRALVAFASDGSLQASRTEIEALPDTLMRLGKSGRHRAFEPRRADIVMAGSVIVSELARRLRLSGIEAASGGLREGLLVDLAQRIGEQERQAAHS